MSNNSLIKKFEIDGKVVDIGSDWHLEGEDIVNRALARIASKRQSEVLFCMGDLFDAQNGEDTSESINRLLTGLAETYDNIIYTPGNHDLRGRIKPWESFTLPPNVHYPKGEEPLIFTLGDKKVLIADLFYDMNFIDPAIVGLGWEKVISQYRSSNDGKYFLEGKTEPFAQMTERAAQLLQADIDILATHSLPHPSLVTFRVQKITDDIVKMAEDSGLQFISNPAEDKEGATRWDFTPEDFRTWWNTKSIFMGSDLVGHPNANPKNGLWVVHGHHHRNDLNPRTVKGKTVNIATHQPNPWKWKEAI